MKLKKRPETKIIDKSNSTVVALRDCEYWHRMKNKPTVRATYRKEANMKFGERRGSYKPVCNR